MFVLIECNMRGISLEGVLLLQSAKLQIITFPSPVLKQAGMYSVNLSKERQHE